MKNKKGLHLECFDPEGFQPVGIQSEGEKVFMINGKRLMICLFILFFAAVPSFAITPPNNLNAIAHPGEKVLLSWDKVADAVGYNVYRKAEGDAGYRKISPLIRSTSFSDQNVRQGKSYSYYVTAVGAADAESIRSNFSSAPNMFMNAEGKIFHLGGKQITRRDISTKKLVAVAVPGDIINYIIRFGNNGYGSATDTLVTFPVPEGTRLLRNSVNPGKFNLKVSYFDKQQEKWISELKDEKVISKIRFRILDPIIPQARGYNGEISFKVLIET